MSASQPFRPLDFPAGYANDVMRHVIDHNCARCSVPTPTDVAEFGPGGCCAILSAIFVDDSIPELTYDGTTVRCDVRVEVAS